MTIAAVSPGAAPISAVQVLEDRIAELEAALGLGYEAPPVLGLTPYEQRMLGMLLKTEGVTPHAKLLTALYAHTDEPGTYNTLSVHATRLRKKLGASDSVRCHWGRGYSLSQATRARLAELR